MSVPWYLMAKGKGGGGYKTASGPIVSISDAVAAPLRALSLAIDPVQDLHGYDSPWPAGGGKNLLDPSVMTTYSSGNGRRWYYDDGYTLRANQAYTFSVSGSSQLITLYFVEKSSGETLVSGSAGGKITYTPTTDIVVYLQAYRNEVIQDANNFQLELGTTATPYAPYSNLCPISGWDGANLWRTGKNLLALTPCWRMNYNPTVGAVDNIVSPIDTTWTDNGDGTFSLASLGSWASAGFLTPLLPAGTYTYHIEFVTGSTVRKSINVYDANYVAVSKSTSQPAGAVSETRTITLTEPGYIGIGLYGYGEAITIKEPGVYVGSTYTAYTPYTGTTIPVIWSEAGTVYGGEVDVINGVLRVTHAEVDLGTLDWSAWGTVEGLYGANISDMQAPTTADERKTEIICSMYPVAATATMNNNFTDKSCARYQQNVFLRDTGYATADALTAALDGVQFVYPLATPLTYTLTPAQLDTLAGQNVVWGDCGDVTVEYLSAGGANPDLMKLAVAFMGRK